MEIMFNNCIGSKYENWNIPNNILVVVTAGPLLTRFYMGSLLKETVNISTYNIFFSKLLFPWQRDSFTEYIMESQVRIVEPLSDTNFSKV